MLSRVGDSSRRTFTSQRVRNAHHKVGGSTTAGPRRSQQPLLHRCCSGFHRKTLLCNHAAFAFFPFPSDQEHPCASLPCFFFFSFPLVLLPSLLLSLLRRSLNAIKMLRTDLFICDEAVQKVHNRDFGNSKGTFEIRTRSKLISSFVHWIIETQFSRDL